MNIQATIQDWFKHSHGGSLMLPNGWFGRPYDNIHRLTSVSLAEDLLTVSLDDGWLILRFGGIQEVYEDQRDLVFSGFHRLDFDWKEYGNNELHSESFSAGVVKIVAIPGR
jgi:hypothetical protein